MKLDAEILDFFTDEASDSLNKLEASCISLIEDQSQRAEIETIFRTLHNLKGTSKALGLDTFGDFIHRVEDYFLAFKNGEKEIAISTLSLLLEVQEHLMNWLTQIKDSGGSELEYDVSFIDQKLVGTEDHVQIKELSPKEEKDLSVLNEKSTNPKKHPTKEVKKKLKTSETVRVTTSKIDDLLNNIAELTINASMIKDAFSQGNLQRLEGLLEQNHKMLKNVQDKSFELRMNNLKGLFQRIQRAALQISAQQGKEIEIIISGEDVELDRSVIDMIGEALTHIIRNAVDHGIENKEERKVIGKNERAKVHLLAIQEADSVRIEIVDDGRGMCPKKLIEKAMAKGLISSFEGENFSDQQAYDLIFKSGFSTAEVVTDVSGRGVGMSAVKDTIEELCGEVTIHSKVGEGTSFVITLPTSVSIIDGIATKIFDQNIIIPIRKIKEIVSCKDLKIQRQLTGDSVVDFRGYALNVEFLDNILANQKSDQQEVCYIIEKGSKLLGVVGPGSLKMSQVVVKKTGAKLAEFPYYNGITILGNGEPAFILDVHKIHENFYSGAQQWSKVS
jgi:two-component system chemotaxis sensor kinase CheA